MPQLSQDKNLPAAITNLRLCSALQGCGRIDVAEAFDKCSAALLYVYDDGDLGYTDWTDNEPEFISQCFNALNPNNTEIALLPLDGRIFTGKSVVVGGVCDGMLLTDKEMCLIEFKTDVTSPHYLTIIQRASEAIEQLCHTFSIIKQKCASQSKDIEQLLSISFYVTFDRELEITRANASLMDLMNQFLEDHKHQLYFDNTKTFK